MIRKNPAKIKDGRCWTEEKGQRQYRLKGGNRAHEQIAREQDLIAATRPAPPTSGS